MTRKALGVGAWLFLSTSLASAGALDRTGQPIGVIFEDGNYVELSFGFTRPEVRGVFTSPFTGAQSGSGDVGADFSQVALSLKYHVTEQLSFALILDQPFGAEVDYRDADEGYAIGGTFAEFESTGVTALGRYEIDDRWSLHAGARWIRIKADLFIQQPILGPDGRPRLLTYDGDFDSDSDVGFVVGGAYERDEFGLRVALTYSSQTEFSHETSYKATECDPSVPSCSAIAEDGLATAYALPQSLTLDVQTGIAADTALFGSIRWADWSETVIEVPNYVDNPVVEYNGDILTYTLGIGRRFTERLSASGAVIYEAALGPDFNPATGEGVANLSPTDGQLALQLAASYAVTDSFGLSGGVRYTRLGDATTRGIGARFADNDALSLGLQAGLRF